MVIPPFGSCALANARESHMPGCVISCDRRSTVITPPSSLARRWSAYRQRLRLAQQRGLGDDRPSDAMMEFDPLAQMEDVGLAVLKEFPGFGEVDVPPREEGLDESE